MPRRSWRWPGEALLSGRWTYGQTDRQAPRDEQNKKSRMVPSLVFYFYFFPFTLERKSQSCRTFTSVTISENNLTIWSSYWRMAVLEVRFCFRCNLPLSLKTLKFQNISCDILRNFSDADGSKKIGSLSLKEAFLDI